MVLQLAAIVGEDGNGAVFVEDDVVAVFKLDQAQIVIANDAVELGLDLGLLELALRNAADVKGAHGELGARLANGLGGDDAGGFA